MNPNINIPHIKDFKWTWCTLSPAAKYCYGFNVSRTFNTYIIREVETNVISGGRYQDGNVITIFTDNGDDTWTVRITSLYNTD